MTIKRQQLILISLIALFISSPTLADRVAMVPLELGASRQELGSAAQPHELMELIRNPEYIRPGAHVVVFKPGGREMLTLPADKKQFSATEKWAQTKSLLKAAGWKIPAELKAQDVKVKSIRVTGTASTYGRNDGFAGQRTSSGRFVTTSTAALQMDLAHVLSDMGVVPFSMRDVKATLTMPDGSKVAKRLEDKGGLVNYLGENYWRKAIKSMKVDQNGVGTLAPLPASHYRVVDIFTQRRSTLIPQVTVEIHLKKPLIRKAALSAAQCQAWMQKNFKSPVPESQGFMPDFE